MDSIRRELLDSYLESFFASFEPQSFSALDIGGIRGGQSGTFRRPESPGQLWTVLNSDPTVDPDVLGDAHSLPFAANEFDLVLVMEVLEHLTKPEIALGEAFRVLKHEGAAVLSIPFLVRVHGDPDDYQRWTPSKIRMEAVNAGFQVVRVEPMGGFAAVVFDLSRSYLTLSRLDRNSKLLSKVGGLALQLLRLLGLGTRRDPVWSSSWITTGFWVVLSKP